MFHKSLTKSHLQNFVIAVVTFLFLIPNALAGDFAKREILGFSVTGELFAFEEYGVQDGSGFPYSNIYIISTQTDEWTSGSPFRVRLEDENDSLEDARQQAHGIANSALGVITQSGLVVATNRATEIAENSNRMVATPRVFSPPSPEKLEFRLQTTALPAQEYCSDFGQTLGFSLKQIFDEPGKATKLLHEDTTIPNSRNCPLDYRLADIVTFHPDGYPAVAAVLIFMEQVGFEGPDGRFLAVTTQLD